MNSGAGFMQQLRCRINNFELKHIAKLTYTNIEMERGMLNFLMQTLLTKRIMPN